MSRLLRHVSACLFACAALAAASAAWAGDTVCPRVGGPDVIVGDITDIGNYGPVGGIDAFDVGTSSCNVGDADLSWVANTNQHPVIGQNFFRLNNGRFEQIGQAWLKHGFTALTQDLCGCGCNGHGGPVLGVGCSDPYCCGLNGSQAGLGPKFEVNPHTGAFPYPYTAQGKSGNFIYKRVQVKLTDLVGGQYFAEGHYVTPDDAAAGRQNSNASYRPILITGGPSDYVASVTGQTARERPGLRAWRDYDSGVRAADIQVADDGLLIVAGKSVPIVTPMGQSGTWHHFEIAVQNLNADRAVGSVAAAIGAGATVLNVGFHDVDYHGDPAVPAEQPYDLTDWPGVYAGGSVSWSTTPFGTNPNANALRWGTLYNFRFDSNVVPSAATQITLGLFKPGVPASVNVVLDLTPLENDTCAFAIPVGNGATPFNNVGATTDGPDEVGACNFGGYSHIESDVWFRYVATCTGNVIVDVCNSDFDTKLAVYPGHCPATAGTVIACGDDGCGTGGTRSSVTFAATFNQEYLIRIGGRNGAQGSGMLTIACQATAVAADACAAAMLITPGTYYGSTAAATQDGTASCGTSNTTPDVWYAFTAPANGTMTVNTCGSSYDTVLSIHSACPGTAGNTLNCNNDCPSIPSCGSTNSCISRGVVTGTTYVIRVSGWSGSTGAFVLTLGYTPTAPANDACANAMLVGAGATAFSTLGATTDGPDEAAGCSKFGYVQIGGDAWYRYVAPCTGTVTIDVCDASFDSKLAVYGSACPSGPSTAIACSDDACGVYGLRSRLSFTTNSGSTYRIRIGGYNGQTGTGTLAIAQQCITDCNANNIGDAVDIAQGTSQDCNGNLIPDECDIYLSGMADCNGGPVGVAANGAALWAATCTSCHGATGTGGVGPNIRNYTRDVIWRKVLPLLPVDGQPHPGGYHPTYTQQNFADLEAFLADGGSRGRPDRVPDICQSPLPDCDNDAIADACELAAGTQIDANYDGLPDGCGCQGPHTGNMNGDAYVDGRDVRAFTAAVLSASTSPTDLCAGDFSGNMVMDAADTVGMVNALLAP